MRVKCTHYIVPYHIEVDNQFDEVLFPAYFKTALMIEFSNLVKNARQKVKTYKVLKNNSQIYIKTYRHIASEFLGYVLNLSISIS